MCYLLPVAKFLANWPFLELLWTGLVPQKRLSGDSFGGQPKQGFSPHKSEGIFLPALVCVSVCVCVCLYVCDHDN